MKLTIPQPSGTTHWKLGLQMDQNVEKVHSTTTWTKFYPILTFLTGRNCFNLFQILFSANTADTDPGVSGVSKDQKFYEKFKNTHCQVDHPAKIE